ncbi:MAG: hypothetical protein AAB390_00185 [Patescibacteria group bacterium]
MNNHGTDKPGRVKKISLSDFFPAGTEYFYAFPAGEDSEFFNRVPPWKEEIVAARTLICAGEGVKVAVFANTLRSTAWNLINLLHSDLKSRVLVLPECINSKVKGKKRNRLMVAALREFATEKKLVMAQPFLNKEIQNYFQIDPSLSVWFNDKKNMPEYIPAKYLPRRYDCFPNGAEFFRTEEEITLPCVVKVSSSSSGDGVLICHSETDLEKAKKKFRHLKNDIIIEEYIKCLFNIGVQFGIPYQKSSPIEIIGHNQQLVGQNGEYLGAVITKNNTVPHLEKVYDILLKTILPDVRRRGWYGVGGYDVLIDKDGRICFIDSNLRMTAASVYLFMVKNREIKRPVITFTGSYYGTVADFKKKIVPLCGGRATEDKLRIIALTENDGSFHFNAAMFYDSPEEIPRQIRSLLKIGIKSKVLKRLLKNKLTNV